MDFRVLGPLEVSRGGAPVRIGSRMQRRLLALLLIHPGASLSADRVIDVLWAGQAPPSASRGLHAYVSRLRRLLGDGTAVVSDGHGYRLSVDDQRLDARQFEQLVAAGRARLTAEPREAAAALAEALALWRGPAYAEFAGEDFARGEAVRLEELRLAASEDAFAARLACGDAELVGDLEAFVTANPLRERPHALLMGALGQAGRQSEALEVFGRVRRRLTDELGLEPSPVLQQAQAGVLRQAPGVTPAPSDPVGRRGGQVTGNLPRPVTSFVGRGEETAVVCRLLEGARLVTLSGVGGVGKTRLALQAADAVAPRYPDGVWWCELAPADPDAVGHAVAAVLAARQQANRTIADSIVGALAGKRLLLVLDNCEHVVDASARLAEHLLRSCPELSILATSREPLVADGEQVWVVPPLPLPCGHGDGFAAPSTQLFHDRARAARADFAPDESTAAAVADVCRRLDGLPLAIELAAALVPALEPAEIARRLGHRFGLLTHGRRADPRHRSLAAVVDWSYQQLDPGERQLFDRSAVFSGGFTLPAVEGVCADEDLPPERIAGLLAGLVSRSMVGVDRSATPSRYHLLETLRHYGGARLTERGEESALRGRHAAWFVDLAEAADVGVRGPGETTAVAQIESELANLRAAHRWAAEDDDADLDLRLAAALHVFALWRLRDEVFDWAGEALELPGAVGHRLRPTVLGMVARGLSNRGELARSREVAERALAAAPDVGDPRRLVALDSLEAAALYEGRLEDCRNHAGEALASARRQGDDYNRTQAQMHAALALVYGRQRAAGLEEALALRAAADRLGNPHHRAWARYVQAEACGDGDPDTALALLEEALALAEPVDDRFLEGVARVAATSLRARHRSPREALASFPGVIGHWRRAGDWTHQWTTLRNLVPLFVRLDAHEPAALLCGAQRAADTAAPPYGADALRLDEACQALAVRLGTAALDRLVEQGEQLNGAEAVDLALASIAGLLDA